MNLTAPNPVTNATFTDVLGRCCTDRRSLPIPSFGPRLLLGRELADALLFTGQRVLPTKLQASRLLVQPIPELADALRAILNR